jgi:Kef-type K+ transport system membrane component KefB
MELKVVIAFVLLDVAIVVAAARLVGKLFRRIGQPAVIGELAAGIALGPTLLGLLPGDLDLLLFPTEVRGYLAVIAQLGLVLFMFIVGLEVDLSLIRGRERAAGAIAASSMLVPFALGAGVAVLLHPFHDTVAGRPVPMLAFVLFMAVAMSITALPVLARILTERGMQRTPVGVLALACAAIDDVLGWSLLAVVVAVAAGGDPAGVARIIGLTAVFAAAAFLLLRPLLARMVGWYDRAGRLTPDMLAAVLVGLLLSAFVTEEIGVHAIFGAFVFGAIMPRRGAAGLTREILERLEQVSLLLLLPVFFVVAGLQVDIAAIGVAGLWQLGLILVAAIAGKLLGGAVAARAQRMPRRQSTAVGLLMNTRGLTEIVILQVGVQLGLLDPAMFTLMVIMALVTTAMTGPLLHLVYPPRVLQRELAAADRAAAGEVDSYTVLVAVPEERSAEFVEVARQVAGCEVPVRIVLSRLLPAPVQLEVASGVSSDLATIAEVGDELRRLGRALETDGRVTCSVVVRFSADPAADLAALADTVRADVVVAGGHPGDGSPRYDAPLPRPGGAAGVRVRLGRGTPAGHGVAAHVDGGEEGRTAIRLGAQVALARRAALTVRHPDVRRAARQAAGAVEALRRRGLDVEDPRQDGPGPADVLVTPASVGIVAAVSSATTVLCVQTDEADRDDELEQTIARIRLPEIEDAAARSVRDSRT